MKVLHILNELKHSGAEVMLQLAHDRFKGSGIESHILSTGDQVGDYAAVLRDYRVHHIPFRRSLRFLIHIRKLLRQERFTAVHIHTERAFFWYALLAKLAGVPIVVRTFHSIRFPSPYLRWKKVILRRILRNVFRTHHVAISESVCESEKKTFSNRCLLIRNWTDIERFRPPTVKERSEARHLYNLEDEDFVVVTIGTCDSGKNHIAILSAIEKVNASMNGKRVALLHVGVGPMLQEEQLYVRRQDIEQHCRFIGTVEDVRPYLYAADAFAMTSQWEGLPVAAVEAMSTGLPVILYNVPGLRDLVQNGKGGLLVEPTEDRLVEALLLLSKRPELRLKYGEQARETIVSSYSLNDSVDKLIQIYGGQKAG